MGAHTPYTGLWGRGRRGRWSDTGPEQPFPAASSWGGRRISQAPSCLLPARFIAAASSQLLEGGPALYEVWPRYLCNCLGKTLFLGRLASQSTARRQEEAWEPRARLTVQRCFPGPGLRRSPVLTAPRRLASRGHGCCRPLRVLGSSSLTRDRRRCSTPLVLCASDEDHSGCRKGGQASGPAGPPARAVCPSPTVLCGPRNTGSAVPKTTKETEAGLLSNLLSQGGSAVSGSGSLPHPWAGWGTWARVASALGC